MGTGEHSQLQLALGAYFFRRRKAWNVTAATEVRVQIREGKYLIPDIYVARGQTRLRGVLGEPPLLWIEILSPEDRTVRVNRKVKDLLAFGIPYVWVIDPETLESELHSAAGRTELMDGILRIEGTEIVVPLKDVLED